MKLSSLPKIDKNGQSYQLGYSDAVKYGMPRNLRDYPNGCLQIEYNAGYCAGARKTVSRVAA